jgi:hypothetical protein
LISQRTLAGWEVWWTRFSPRTSAQPPHLWWVTYMFVCSTDGFCLGVFLLHTLQDVPIKGFRSPPHPRRPLVWPVTCSENCGSLRPSRLMICGSRKTPYPGSKEVFEAASSWEQ